jgi:hypothetical protein
MDNIAPRQAERPGVFATFVGTKVEGERGLPQTKQ